MARRSASTKKNASDALADAPLVSLSEIDNAVAQAAALEQSGQSRQALSLLDSWLARDDISDSHRLELGLLAASNEFIVCNYPSAHKRLSAATVLAKNLDNPIALARVKFLSARTLHQQGSPSTAFPMAQEAMEELERLGEYGQAARASQTLTYISLDRCEYSAAVQFGERGLSLARKANNDFFVAGMCTALGLVHYTIALSQQSSPHARANPLALELSDIQKDSVHAETAKAIYQEGIVAARRSGFETRAWMLEGRIERANILLGNVDEVLRNSPKRIQRSQTSGDVHEEIGYRQTYAWALRLKGQLNEALHQLDTVLLLARKVGTLSRSIEYAHYDRSLVLAALGRHADAQASYRAYLRFVAAWNRQAAKMVPANLPPPAAKPAIEPYFLKKADAYIAANLRSGITLDSIAAACNTSVRNLQVYFRKFRGVSPMAHVRMLRLDAVAEEVRNTDVPIAELAHRYGFMSSTTFSAEFKLRFGVSPRKAREEARRLSKA
ncbi:MAG: helix-turn-helix transcriptional regulator [Betaproteobacteria bacterium]|nr:helix-turn-helix transcriptional regulator [Betaproteobacteria bacterium]